MMEALKNFIPGGTLTIAASTTSANGQLNVTAPNSPQKRRDIRIVNPSANGLAFFKLGSDNTVVATVNDTPVQPGASELFHANDSTWIAFILLAGTGSVYVTSGFGN